MTRINYAGAAGGGASTQKGNQIQLGSPSDGSWTDGVISFTDDTSVTDAVDELNETMSYLAPDDAASMDADTLTTAGTTFYAGRLSSGNTNYKVGDTSGSTVSYITNDASFTILSPNQSTTFNKADEGVFNYHINTVLNDSVNLAANFNEAERGGTQTSTPWVGPSGNISVTSVSWYNDFPKWQKGNATATVVAGDLQQGYNSFFMRHSGISTAQTTSTLDLFYDNDAGANPSVTTPTLAEATPSFRYLSGVKMYNRASTFNLAVSGLDCFDNVYHQTSPLTYSSTSSTLSSGNIDHDDSSVTGLTDPPAIGETMIVTNKVLTVPNSNLRSTNARATITPRDPYGSYTAVSSASENRLIDAYTTTSTVLEEYFDDENRRMPSGTYNSVPGTITGLWNSASGLNNGEAQVYNGQLFFPSTDFSSGYLPTGNPDYSGFTGDQVFYRVFFDDGTPHSSGQLELGNLTSSDVGAVGASNVNVEIKLPTQTGWLDLGTSFDNGTFTGADGDGCKTAQSGDDWSWTAGTFTTANSGYLIIVKITLRNTTDSLTQVREVAW